LITLRQINAFLLSNIRRLYFENPLRHYELVHGMLYSLETMEGFFDTSRGIVTAYMLVFRERNSPRVVVHRWSSEIESAARSHVVSRFREFRMIALDPEASEGIEELLSESMVFNKVRIRDFVVDEDSFRGSTDAEKAIRLTPVYNARQVSRFLTLHGVEMTTEEAAKFLAERRCYGVFDSRGELTALACRRVCLREVWTIEDMLCSANHLDDLRNALEMISRDAVMSGARVLALVLETRTELEPLLKDLGYRHVGHRTLYIAKRVRAQTQN